MTNNAKIILAVILVVLIGLFVYSHKSQSPGVVVNQPTSPEIVIGCYVAHLAKDVYLLHIKTQDEDMFSGTLAFRNFEKDSSSGTYSGTYENGILLGDYSFSSEGMNSVRQVIFKKSGANFVEGFGGYTSDQRHFADLNSITYDPNSTFVPSTECKD